MNQSTQRVLIGIVIVGIIVAGVILLVNNRFEYNKSATQEVTNDNIRVSPEVLEKTSSDEILLDIEEDLAALESEYDFSADFDSELLLVPDFDSELLE